MSERHFPSVLLRVIHGLRRASRSLFMLGFVLLFGPQLAHAGNDTAAAEVLFQAGRKAMEEKRYDAACEKFEESSRLDAAPGTVMNLATCEEKRGDLAAAWERWQQALGLLEPDDDRRAFASSRLQELEAQLPRLTLRSPVASLQGFAVERDGVVLRPASLGAPIPVNPGAHVIKVVADRHEEKVYRLDIKPGEQKELVVHPGPELPPEPTSDDRLRARKTQMIFGTVAAGVGAVGLGTGIVTSFLVKKERTTVDENCLEVECNQEGMDAAERGKTLVALNTAGFIAAGVGAAAATVLFLTLPSAKEDGARDSQVALGFPDGGLMASFRRSF